MYAYIDGIVKEINPTNLVVENNGIGYEIVVPNPYTYGLDENIRIYINQQVREDSNTLYGFNSKEQKKVFLLLLKVKGVGPKSALAILAGANSSDIIKAIESSDVNYMTKFPGVGKKSAQQIILDLQGKVDFIAEERKPVKSNAHLVDALLALEALGYGKKDLMKIEKKLASFDYDKTDSYVKEGLKLMMGA
ncbi:MULTISPECIES: Holliday junction branch migration protein RuvA [unclassified Gemella]|uniref:Holliday junction branch migration protein RuvA n=1 Tax=unclassified Gemella TaxID=2624949 RepID=UPI0010738EAC|nr:Holliday junction branch migration protein RuvA [Gemella sp. GL1.1]MBF0746498.1 Holliday junction branch migration protein RuvA [Gemella sp. 19428wG2_WT2a]NYS27542.1 Holliday junction branch migration protein RuvA [Gemella sp. GL1]TFU60277.1 Holliday junction branch migration protein RuvA [Gemella sp. WT2a]